MTLPLSFLLVALTPVLSWAAVPNIVLILTDDQRWDTLDARHGLLGAPAMPILTSELVNSGVTFTNGLVTTSLCSPSRASILTGKYAHNHGVLRNNPPAGGAEAFDDRVTLATLLQDAGYRTGLIGKYLNGYDLLSPYVPPGWDDWRAFVEPRYYDYDLNENGVVIHYASAPADYATDVLTAKATSFISTSVSQGKPFLLFFSPNAPHGPFTPATRHEGLFSGLPNWRPPSYNEPDVSDKPPWVKGLPRLTAAQRAQTDQIRVDQMETLQAVDEAIGAIMQALRDNGVDGNTLVIFSSDNGYAWGEHRWVGKGCPYDECMRVPMIVRYPPLSTGTRQDSRFVLNIDFFPTILELAGLPIPAGTNGTSLVPLLADNAPSWRTDLLNEHWPGIQSLEGEQANVDGDIPRNSLVRNTQHKYAEYPPSSGQGTELYDLTTDPNELVNRTNDPLLAQVKASLATRLRALRT
jgi:arylsulfatase A-like enzyme